MCSSPVRLDNNYLSEPPPLLEYLLYYTGPVGSSIYLYMVIRTVLIQYVHVLYCKISCVSKIQYLTRNMYFELWLKVGCLLTNIILDPNLKTYKGT